MPTPYSEPEGQVQAASRTGRVISFVSAKGGSGKTLLTATAAFVLTKAGQRVLTIDTDFSTGGITLYYMGAEATLRHLAVVPENCLTDALNRHIPIEAVRPRPIPRPDVRLELLLASGDAVQESLADDSMLHSEGLERPSDDAYFHFLRRLLERFRREYDYILIDTRGGFDFSNAAPALLSDGYVVVIEADPISVQQVAKLKKGIERWGERHEIRPALSGFIVNKATSSQGQVEFGHALTALYGGAHFGTIPLDVEAVRAYQLKRIPLDLVPDSDFAQHAFHALEHLISPSLNWLDKETAGFYMIGRQIETLWRARRAWQTAQKLLPGLILVLSVSTAGSYFLIRNTTLVFGNNVFYFCSALFLFASTFVAAFILVRNLQGLRISRGVR